MKVNTMPLAHYEIEVNPEVLFHPDLYQFTGERTACKRFAYYCGLTLVNDGRLGFDSYRLVDRKGTERGQFHDGAFRNDRTSQLVINATWLETICDIEPSRFD